MYSVHRIAQMKPKNCKSCGEPFTPSRPMQKVCSLPCAKTLAEQLRVKREAKEHREAKRKAKTLAQWKREAQAVFNKWIRLRDANEPCISCGRHHEGQYHAGHFRTTKAAPSLRFHHFNNHKQCSACNTHLSGNIVEYRPRLIAKIGLSNVEWLESQNAVYRWTIEDLIEVKAWYTSLIKELEKS